jgi:hypothetical protein
MVARRSLRVSADAAPPAPALERRCPLCDRPLPDGPSVDLHHPVPRALGGTVTVPMHRICHRKLHATYSERELAGFGEDWARLRAQPEVASFVRWVARRPAEFYDGSRRMRRARG